MNLLVLHGPNLNLLGRREPDVYGSTTLAEIDQELVHLAGELGVQLESFQSNHEGELLDRIHESDHVVGFLLNPGGLSHTSVCLRDGLLAMDKPFVEVHCSNVAAREDFRGRSLLGDVAVGVISGFGAASYLLGLRALVDHLKQDEG